MSGPIVRSGPSETYAQNWENVFGSKKTAKKPTKKAPVAEAKKATTKATAKKKK
jgi:hypothetical protein